MNQSVMQTSFEPQRDDSLESEIEAIRSRLQRLKNELKLGNDGGKTSRGQVPASSNLEQIINYNLDYGLGHAFELRDAVLHWAQHFSDSCHLLDLGCGIGLADIVLRICGIETLSYAGVDHNREMLKIAFMINPGSSFTQEMRSLERRRGSGLVIINHLFGQNELLNKNISDFCFHLSKIFNNEVMILNVEPNLSSVNLHRRLFQDEMLRIGFKQETEDYASTATQFRVPKNSWFARYKMKQKSDDGKRL